jgi:hypothetical protein
MACRDRPAGEQQAPAPQPQTPSLAPIAEITSIDWRNLTYHLGSLGEVKATNGRAEFRVEEDDEGVGRAIQLAGADGAAGSLVVDAPRYTDLDGDHHDEAVIAFELTAANEDVAVTYGVFVYTLRQGEPRPLATLRSRTKDGITITGTTLVVEGTPWRVP